MESESGFNDRYYPGLTILWGEQARGGWFPTEAGYLSLSPPTTKQLIMSIDIKTEALKAISGGNVQTEADFKEVLERFKAQHPAKYAERLASGDFERQKARLFGKEKSQEFLDAVKSAEKVAHKAQVEIDKKVADAKAVIADLAPVEKAIEKPKKVK
mgnify:CR=1 FL=1